ncbi:hypothetical protein [Rasiella sp. SM2506]|uniref:hypothetical protein n=1 Tax=Rasiella sp. SM2506 TaxID=3423914 RepID=UPI003D7B46CC
MKKLIFFTLIIVFSTSTYAQIGINTTNPQATLDIEGTVRIKNTKGKTLDGENIIATKIVGLDEQGNIVELTTDTNVYLENNIIKTVERKVELGSLPEFSGGQANNVSLIVFPGGSNGGKTVIRLQHDTGNFDITGFDVGELGGPAAADGYTVWLFAVDGDVNLRAENNGSTAVNRIAANNDITIEQFQMVKILYDGVLQRWVIMSGCEHN